MLTREGLDRTDTVDQRLACSLAAVAGALNTAGFSIVGFYSSNMTGNVSAVANAAAMRDLATAATYFALVASFVAGAAVSTVLINLGYRSLGAAVYARNILLEAVLLFGLGCADLWLPGIGRTPMLALGLSFLLGLQNALVTRISNARIRTTHVTGMVTDIGIELGNLAALAVRGDPADEGAFNKGKLRLHAATVGSFLAGGAVGVWGYEAAGPYFFLATSAVLVALASPSLLRHARP